MGNTRNAAISLTFAAALLGGGALAPSPASAQGVNRDERSRWVTTPDGEVFYRRGEDERLTQPWAGRGRDPMSGNETRRGSSDWNLFGSDQSSQDRTMQGARDAYDYGYRAGREDERNAGQLSSGMASNRELRAAMEFLDNARMQINRGNLREAWVALGQAETRLLTRSLPEGSSGEAATGAAIGAIREARQALREREVDRARSRTARAMELASSGQIVGRNTAGWRLEGAGQRGEGQPLRPRDWNTGSN
ncbi:hypothetical protein [Falsiroseomonas tokyonensis]|uniref:Uncharacterized protein n=1 Tax=Falsiroseomonas tokyonensis TaxID=430521 RepID=A0ABV7BM01_9PROT|nr:hypothetical protein [Falsiroseomonas tokyonensis]MBU8536605.1 hypothetical protein [Falsiroseomonas tokyonensis]